MHSRALRTVSTAVVGAIKSRCLVLLPAFVLAACGGVDSSMPEGEFVPAVVEWSLVLEDNFDGAVLDTGLWNIDVGDGCPEVCGWGNNELQVYSPANIDVSGGTLKLRGQQENDGSYTSARINTKGKFDFTYGKVEVRARVPAGMGTWPAIWALHSPAGGANPAYPDEGVYGPWPLSGEIDIMEAFNYGPWGESTKSTTHYGMQIPPYEGTGGFAEKNGAPLTANADMQFYTYGMEWERGRIRYFVEQDSLLDRDGQVSSTGHFQTQTLDEYYVYYPANSDGYYDPLGALTTDLDNGPFDQAFHLIMNFAIGGNAVGAPDPATIFPQALEIDYVRIYECVNSNPDTRRGCGAADATVVPLEDHDGGPLENADTARPYIESVGLYRDGPETVTVQFGNETATNTLTVDGFTGPAATVTSNPAAPDPDDPANIVWQVAISGDVANVFLASEDLSADPILDTGFDFSSTGPAVGEVVFDMYVNSVSADANIVVKLDSGFPNVGEFVLPLSELAIGEWKAYSVKFEDLVDNPGFVDCCGGVGVDLASVINPFVFEVTAGAVDVLLDNIRVTNACYVVGACNAGPITRGVPDLVVFDDAVNTATWSDGIGAASDEDGFINYYDGTLAKKTNWATIDDPDDVATRGQVIDVTFNDNEFFGVWFVGSPTSVNMSAYSAGAVVFDIIVDDYGNSPGMTFKIDCFFPCTSGDKNIGRVGDGVWETVTFPVSQLTGSGLDLNNVSSGIVLFPTAPQSGGIDFRLDNIRWVAETTAPPLNQIDLPVTFDNPTVDYTLSDFGGNGSGIGTDPVDANNNVAVTTKGVGSEVWAGTVIGTGAGFANPIPFTPTETSMSMRIYSPAAGVPVLLKVENDDGSLFSEFTATTTTANAWETLVWDFSNVGIDTSVVYTRAIVFFNFGTAGNDEVYQWDDVEFGTGGGGNPGMQQVSLSSPITFDDPNVDYDLVDFGDNVTTLVVDPANMSNTVASTIKPVTAPLWAGTTVGGTNGLAEAIPFTATDTTMTVRVYSPDAGIPVRLKVEDKNDPTVSVETEVMTTVANAWEMLTFDLANEVGGTSPINLASTYDKFSVFFNFGTDGMTAGEKTYLWDDITFVTSGGGGSQIGLPVTFEDAGLDYELTDFGGVGTTMPAVDPVDAANTVASTNKPVGAQLWGGTTVAGVSGLNAPIPFTMTDTSMTVRVYSPDAGIPVRLKVEDKNDPTVSVETEATTIVANVWETLTFDFSNEVGGTPALNLASTYDKASIFFNFGTDGATAGDKTYLWDDVAFASGGGGGAFAPITFDDPGTTYTLTDFGGNASGVASDPAGGANMVVQTLKTDTAQLWAGTTVSTEANEAIPRIPLDAANTQMTVRVYSPDAGIQVRLKVEDASDNTITVETEATTTMANAWETLTFDFANPVTGTAAFDPAATYNKVSIFFNFGVDGATAGNKTYYFDDIDVLAGTGGGGGGGGNAPTSTDFEGAPGSYLFSDFDGGVATVIANPDVSGINTSASVGQMQKFAGQPWGGSTLDLGGAVDWSAGEVYTMKVRSPRVVDVLLKLEGLNQERTATHGGTGWEELCFDFTGATGGAPATAITLIFDNGVMGDAAGDPANWTFQFDDIQQQVAGCPGGGGGGGAFAPITFDDPGTTYTLTDFGGNASVVTNDPAGGANMVVEALKTDTAQLWAGTTVSTEANEAIPTIPLDAANTQMTVRVYSPDAGIQVRLKVEDASDNTITVETEATTTMVNAWETLTFDFANPAPGTAAFNPAATYNKVSIFFNFGTDGATAGNKTYYFDDIDVLAGTGGGGGGNAATLTDFEGAGPFNFNDFDGGVAAVIGNPDVAGINSSASVGQMQKFAGQPWGGSTLDLGGAVDWSAGEVYTMKVRSPRVVPVLFKLEGLNQERSVDHTGSGTWDELCFDFTGTTGGAPATAITLIFDLGIMGDAAGDPANWTFEFDDIQQAASCGGGGGGGGGGTADIDFETAATGAGFTWAVFENSDNPPLDLIANPFPGGINSSATVVRFTARVAGQPWAGTETAHGDIGPLTLDASNSMIKIMVYKSVVSDVGIKFAIANGGAQSEIKVANTLINQWEELTFDFTANIGLVESIDIDQIIVFGDFDLAGRTTENIVYFDNISYTGPML
jgi:beta-glucanase (GH16 family)